MKKLSYLVLFILIWSCNQPKSVESIEEILPETQPIYQEVAMPDSVLRHVVLFGFKETSKPEDIQGVIDAFKALPSQISEIKGFEWGINSSPEGLNQGLTHAFTLTFHSAADRDAYLPHPAHKVFGGILGPHLDKVTVVDYWTKP
ncbi:Dabb family protein [Algoriphagus boritolerans]|uniref:Stress responsive A/B Barrel Domain n=2 Tax=Algoriphagus TaxID=246875 RepID=A0A1H5RYI7_9BACT|nr:Dabb family protein [Algoriphagus boritolerans]SEF43413.1 Stress responsive A/B Barrel Domain [Algoriphagus boritolerans DSM 17298 = JCM 18970]